MRNPIVIIGAGIGGLSAAIHLAAAGKRVIVLEKNAATGGKMGEIEAEGFRWDTGPSVITMRPVFEDLFRTAGRRLEDYLTLLPLQPLTRYFYADGSVLDVDADPQVTAQRLEHYHTGDGQGYLDFLSYADKIHEATGDVFIYGAPPTWRTLLGVNPLRMVQTDALRTMQRAIESFVHSPQTRQLLGRFATYTGASPYLAPATLNVIAHVELNEGVWYPQGGIAEIAKALTRLAGELGVEIRTNCGVDGIDLTFDRVTGVRTAGERIETDHVIANVDVITVYERLLPPIPSVRRELARLTKLEPSSSGFILLLGVEGEHPHLAHHNIFFSGDYADEFRDIFQRGLPPRQPTIYVAITAKSDPQHAPPGCENWFVLVNTPPEGEGTKTRFDWHSQASNYSRVVLDRLATAFDLDVREQIRTQQILTPPDLEALTAARRGALYGQSSNDRMAAFRRPHNRSAAVKGLYFAGGTAHPGGGVPMVTLSGKVAAGMALADT
jgi:phytoene desaturase